MKKLKFLLTLWDGIWSIPLSLLIFFLIGIVGQAVFGRVVGFYDPSIWQTVFLAAGILVTFNFVVWFTLWFNFRAVFRYFVGEKLADGTIDNQSKKDGKSLTAWQRIKLCLAVYLFYLFALVLILRVIIK